MVGVTNNHRKILYGSTENQQNTTMKPINQNKMKYSKELTKWLRKRFWNDYILYRNKELFETYVKNNYIKEIHSIEHHTFKSENEKVNNWITGANDPSAPFNQIDLEDKYPYLLPHCLWITDEMYDDDYSTLEDAFDLVISNEETIGLNNPYNKIDWEIQDVSKLSNQIERTFNELKCLKNDKKI